MSLQQLENLYKREHFLEKWGSTIFYSLLTLIALVCLIPVFVVISNRIAYKDCRQAQVMSSEYPKYQVEKSLAEMCHNRFNIDFRP